MIDSNDDAGLPDGRVYRDQVETADVLVMAGRVRDRYLSATWKTFFDRSFVKGHRPVLQGKLAALIVSGPVRQLPNMRETLVGMIENWGTPLLGLVTDEAQAPETVTAELRWLATELIARSEDRWQRPANFRAVAGRKIFRDMVYRFQTVMRADHRHYVEQGYYDFPPFDLRLRLSNWMTKLAHRVPGARQRFVKQMTRRQVTAYRQVLEEAGRR